MSESRSDALYTRMTLIFLALQGCLSRSERLRLAFIRLLPLRCTGAAETLLRQVLSRPEVRMQLQSWRLISCVRFIAEAMEYEFRQEFFLITNLPDDLKSSSPERSPGIQPWGSRLH